MKAAAAVAAIVLLTASPQAGDDSDLRFTDSVERTFAPAGTVQLDLSAGDYRVRRGEDRRLRVIWHTRTAEQMDDVRVRADVRGSEAFVTTWGPDNNFRVEIELPGRSDLHLRMSAGDLSIAGIEGHKDVRLRAGNLDIEVADPDQYGHVRASVTAGDLKATPFGVNTGGLFRSFTHEGRGRFDLRARLWAGDLRLSEEVPPRRQ